MKARRSPSGIDPPPALYRRIRESLRSVDAPTRQPLARVSTAMAIAAAAAIVIVVIASDFVYRRQAVGLHVDLQSERGLIFVGIALLLLMLTTTVASLWRGRSGLEPNTATLLTVAVAGAPLYALLVLPNPVHVAGSGVGSLTISPWGARCLVVAALVGGVVMSSLTMAMRRAAPVASKARALALGSAAGVWAGLAVFVFCPSGDQMHLLVGHVIPVAAFALIGGVMLPRMLRP